MMTVVLCWSYCLRPVVFGYAGSFVLFVLELFGVGEGCGVYGRIAKRLSLFIAI